MRFNAHEDVKFKARLGTRALDTKHKSAGVEVN